MQIDLKLEGLDGLLSDLGRVASNIPGGFTRALYRIGTVWKRTAVQYAPISPTQAKLGSKSKRRAMPGGLMRSIMFYSTEKRVEVFVPSNAPAGKYAAKIHDEKGKSWRNRGPGTIAKGPQADEKFILRAALFRSKDFAAIVKDEIDKVITKKG